MDGDVEKGGGLICYFECMAGGYNHTFSFSSCPFIYVYIQHRRITSVISINFKTLNLQMHIGRRKTLKLVYLYLV